MDLLGVVAGFHLGKFFRNDAVVVRGEVSQCEFTVAEDIYGGKAWDPGCMKAWQTCQGMVKKERLRHGLNRNGGAWVSPSWIIQGGDRSL